MSATDDLSIFQTNNEGKIMNKQESNTSFHLKDESTKTGKLPVSEQYLEDKEIQDQTEQLKNQTDISTEGLTETEKKEQALLREEYIASFRKNLRSQLNQIDIQNADGSVENLGEKYGKKVIIE